MKKTNIVIFDSSPHKKSALMEIIQELGRKDLNFSLCHCCSDLLPLFSGNNYGVKKIWLGPRLSGNPQRLFFFFLLPWLRLYYFFYLIFLKYYDKTETVICTYINEKLIISPIARLLKIKVYWFEFPDIYLNKGKSPFLSIYRRQANKTNILVFNSLTKNQLENMAIQSQHIHIVQPGIRFKQHQFQNNLFNELAQLSGQDFKNKFFTIGTIIDLDKNQNIEGVLRAVKICLDIIPNIQIIIVGEGEERKNLGWLVKKMQMEGMTWFVGQQAHLRKWLDSFDIFITPTSRPGINDLFSAIRAMAAGLPIIGPKDAGLEDIIQENKTGFLIDLDNSEALARQIIRLQQDRRQRDRISELSKEIALENFSLDKQVKKIENLLKK